MQPEFIEVGGENEARRIAVRCRPGNVSGAPCVVWLGGYRSDMMGTKAEAIDQWALANGHGYVRHDYSGHGESGGRFEDGTISRWLEESMAVHSQFCKGPAILVGSSMGAWIALRMAEELQSSGKSLHGMLLLAPAPDFTHELMWPELSEEQRRQLDEQGFIEEVSEYSDEPNIFTKALFEDGERNLVMKGIIQPGCPVHIIQGMKDPDVPHTHALKLAEHLPSDNVTMTMVKDGDHRLSRDEDIALMLRSLEAML
jgi:pimeloyl-ACP methyl ester carboxylesterase